MLGEVNAWVPPSEDHVGLKEFMRTQITESAEFDVRISKEEPQLLTGEEYREREIEYATRHIEYHNKQLFRVKERNAERVLWAQQLIGSLGLGETVEQAAISQEA